MAMNKAVFKMGEVRIVRAEGVKGPGTVHGYAAEFEQLSVMMWDFREKIRKGAFAGSLTRNNVKALWNHNSDFVLGSKDPGTLKLEEDERGLKFELELPDTNAGRDAAVSIERGDVDGMSFGFDVLKQEWAFNEGTDIRTLVEVELREISPTPFPAYEKTSISKRSAQDDYEDAKKAKNAESVTEKEKNQNELELKIKMLDL